MEHPWGKLKQMLKEKGWTQKEFSILIWKKTSEVNELIKGKRNITIQWDYLLYKICGTYKWFWMQQQLTYEYQKFLQELPEDEKRDEIQRIKKRKKEKRKRGIQNFKKF